jgi:DNA-directed RNA polymerase
MDEVQDCINAISATAWRVNPAIVDVMNLLWEQGGNIIGMPPKDDLPLPPRPPEIATDEEIKKAWKKEAAAIHRQNDQLKGMRCDFLQLLSQANEFRDRTIYFPHQLDFRGRAYPVPPVLNHQGDDLRRGMLHFAEGEPLDDDGRWWLRVHAANTYGHDKLPYADRVAWTQEYEARGHTRRISRDPIEHFDLWANADKPLQFLAACMALEDDELAATLPIQIDGTCNGLQHYAAMLRDREGAAVVNMLRSDAPSDIYTAVANAVKPKVLEDAQAGDETAQALYDVIKRSLVKRPVMTSVYGVTRVGASEQIREELGDLGWEDKQVYAAGQYLSKQVLDGIGDVCTSAGKAMDWLRDTAKRVAAAGRLVQWVTPLGLPVIQPYRKWAKVEVRTPMQKIRLIAETTDVPVQTTRQVNGLPPNFVHSIDGTHMLMTGREMHRAGAPFAAVHDSFWTTPGNANMLAKTLRAQFVLLHQKPLLDDFYMQMRELHPDLDFDPPPRPGDYDIAEVAQSPYFFS